jgi:hypothetical protein
MAKWAHADVLDNGLAYLKANTNKLALISDYAAGDSYATVTAKILAEVTTSSANFTLGNGASNSRTLVNDAGLTDGAANAGNTAGTGNLNHFVFLDTTGSKVLAATDESSNQDIYSGNPIEFPVLTFTAPQPV